jgi:hypothetical protein
LVLAAGAVCLGNEFGLYTRELYNAVGFWCSEWHGVLELLGQPAEYRDGDTWSG